MATYIWQWFDDKGAPKAFDAKVAPELEAKYQSCADAGDRTSSITLAGNTYEINFQRMLQANTKSGKVRKIRRLVADGACRLADRTDAFFGRAMKKASTAKKGRVAAAAAAAESDDEPDTSGGGGVGAPALKKSKTETAGADKSAGGEKSAGGKSQGTKMIKKGKGVVDSHSGMASSTHGLEKDAIVWQCTLNQTNVGANNNKFYIIQLLESDADPKKYWVWTRWGRIGAVGQSSLDPYPSVVGAVAQYSSKFRDKTKNAWTAVANNKDAFVKHNGKYHLMDMDYGGDADDDDAAGAAAAAAVPSALAPPLQRVMKLIGNKETMEKTMAELEIDTRKMPLGKISKSQIKTAFGYLKQIETELKKDKPSHKDLVDATSMFYTLIPHDFGFSHPPTINDEAMLKRKMDMLDMLSDLEVAHKVLTEAKKVGKNPLDAAYEGLKCTLGLASAAETKMLTEFVDNTHGKTHTLYRLSVENVFTVNRAGESAKYEANYGGTGNKQLLWHGSRATNFMGILSQGLRIAPPEAPSTGYMFGKGVYFADCATKSGNYCHASPTNPEGILLLCEVALGKTYDIKHAKYMDKPPAGFDSTMGVGKMAPLEGGAKMLDGVKVPMGKMGDTGVADSALLYHEYIVYNVSQLRVKYMLHVKFNYGKK